MTPNPDRLYELLPYVYRQRDAVQGYPLTALLQVIAGQVQVVKDDITQLYENWFIETCEDWIVPYLGDLIGYRPVTNPAGFENSSDLSKILIPRREVANTLRYRRRKGSLALLEDLAQDVAGWPARAVAFYTLLAQTQSLNFLRLERGGTVDLRQDQALRYLRTPFEKLAHTIDVRRLNPQPERRRGFFNIPNVGLFVWRTKVYPLTAALAFRNDDSSHQRTFSILSNDTPLYVQPWREENPADIAGPLNLPIPIQRRDFEARPQDFYGPNKSIQIFEEFACGEKLDQLCKRPVPVSRIIPADLTGWIYRPTEEGKIAVDPELGRLSVAPDLSQKRIWVSYHYGFGADIGGGEYDRSLSQPASYRVSKYTVTCRIGQKDETTYRLGIYDESPLIRALREWANDKPAEAIIEICGSEVYTGSFTINLNSGQSLHLRAANGARPTLRLPNIDPGGVEGLIIKGQTGSRFTLDGLLITGRAVVVQDKLEALTIRHCTLVPGWMLDAECRPQVNKPSLELNTTAEMIITIERCILGSIALKQNEVTTAPSLISISDSILDAIQPHFEALSAGDCRLAHAVLTIKRSTVFGEILTHAIDLAENCIFNNVVRVGRRQRGCMRFCYVDPHPPTPTYQPVPRTPRRYRCQPDLVEQAAEPGKREQERRRVRPPFKSIRYGTPDYAQLAAICAEEIKRGADDESEMGVFHHLYNSQREDNLKARLAEYTPADMEVGLIIVT